ncbi:hexokinase-domain-containing protein [Lipomyces japonicus]|uniref:hexokinase-domain-containing protein n=1 Tax=Lipomyces japonicus TaxID=56871 RepID=UPI0034CD5BD2
MVSATTSTSLDDVTAEIVRQFDVSDASLRAISDKFVRLSRTGLELPDQAMTMIPTFVTEVPTGNEHGTFLAVDLGGTNFRVCSVRLNGDGTFNLLQAKSVIPKNLMVGNAVDLFSFLAGKVRDFISTHLDEHFSQSESHVLKLGFTFSFPINQTAINRGTLIRWTKGFDVQDAVGKDVCLLLQDQLDALNLRVHVAALVNDTVGTLMSRSYASPGQYPTLLGVIIGTGTNAAYTESLSEIKKLSTSSSSSFSSSSPSSIMVVNTEWGSFDNDLVVLPRTEYDEAVDLVTPNPGFQMFEKRVSGMFLGEILRTVLLHLNNTGLLFVGATSQELSTPWSLDTSVLSLIESDSSPELVSVKAMIETDLELSTTLSERLAIKRIVEAIGRRSAYLAGAAIAGVVLHTGVLDRLPYVDVGVDGSVFEFYPGYENLIRESLNAVLGADNEGKIRIGIAKDGSGVGAALCALVA